MKKQNIVMWAVLMAIPFVNLVTSLVMYFVIYGSLKALKPDTKRSIGSDILTTLFTCGIFGYVLPFLIMTETLEGAKRVGVETADYRAPMALVLVFSIGAGILIAIAGLPPELGLFTGIIAGPLQAYFFLTPFNQVVEVFGAQDAQLANR